MGRIRAGRTGNRARGRGASCLASEGGTDPEQSAAIPNNTAEGI
jgi:hypothetical protein